MNEGGEGEGSLKKLPTPVNMELPLLAITPMGASSWSRYISSSAAAAAALPVRAGAGSGCCAGELAMGDGFRFAKFLNGARVRLRPTKYNKR